MNEISFFFNRGGIGCGDERRRWRRRIRERTRIRKKFSGRGLARANYVYCIPLVFMCATEVAFGFHDNWEKI